MPRCLWWPGFGTEHAFITASGAAGTLDAATEKLALCGMLYINGRPASTKTLSAAGGGSISFRLGTTTWLSAGLSSLDVGLQDLDVTTGSIRPDGTFDVKNTLTAPTGLTSAAWNTVSMTGGSGSKTLSHGDFVAVVFDMVTRGGADSVIITGVSPTLTTTPQIPACSAFDGAAWAVTQSRLPNVVITFDDGTLATIDGGFPLFTGDTATDQYDDATNPDERGQLFQVPFDCSVDALWGILRGDSATTADYLFTLYSDPLGTPASAFQHTGLAERLGGANTAGLVLITMATPVNLSKNTNYAVAFKSTSTGDLRLERKTLADEAHRAFLLGGTTCAKVTRNNASGAFSAESPAINHYMMGVRISRSRGVSQGAEEMDRASQIFVASMGAAAEAAIAGGWKWHQDSEGSAFNGQNVEVGQWVVFRPGDAKRIQINNINCRIVEDTQIDMVVTDPLLITHRPVDARVK